MNKKPLKVGMILDVDFPPDERPEKEALSLIKAGYEVHLLCYTSQKRPLRENYKGIQLTRFNLPEKVHKKFSAAYLALPIYRWISCMYMICLFQTSLINWPGNTT